MGKKERGEELFDRYYSTIYGSRWNALKEAMLKPKKHVAILNPFAGTEIEGANAHSTYPYIFTNENRFEPPVLNSSDLLNYYLLDVASIYPVLSLELKSEDHFLDLCAAPGGKSAYASLFLSPESGGRLVSNDLSLKRYTRLKEVLSTFVPDSKSKMVKVTKHDASSWCLHEKEAYHKILLDAPCSSERHLLSSPSDMSKWSEGRSKKIATDQWTMLAGAFLVLKYGGRLVYSTCSISPLENDGVVAKLVKKFGSEVKIIKNSLPGEESEFGKLALPDRDGDGPIYYAVIEKRSVL